MVPRGHHRVLIGRGASPLRAGAIVAAACLLAASASAQEEDDARALFERGVEALEADRYEEAVEVFERARSIEERVSTICNLALAYDRWGGHEWEALAAYLRCAERDGAGPRRAAALSRARELGVLIRAREAAPPTSGDEGTEDAVSTPEEAAAAAVDADSATPRAPPIAEPAPIAQSASAESPPPLVPVGLSLLASSVVPWIVGGLSVASSTAAADALRTRYPDGAIPARRSDGSPNPDVTLLSELETAHGAGIAALVGAGVLALTGAVLLVVGLVVEARSGASAALASPRAITF